MKISFRTPRTLVVLAAVALTSLSSCNRGVGCPTNFSLNDFLGDAVAIVNGLLF